MDNILDTNKRTFTIYILGFLFALHVAISTYISSSFLENILGSSVLGTVYTIGAVTTLIAFLFTNKILRRFGNYRAIITVAFLELLSLITLAISSNKALVFTAFVVSFMSVSLINFSMDIFLESFSTNSDTGKIRGNFLTSVNIAWVAGPILSGMVLNGNDNYWIIYAVAALILLPVLTLIHRNLKNFKDTLYMDVPLLATIEHIWHNKNIRGILSANFLLQVFYSWMVIYTPIYLHQNIGFSWDEIGIIFSIMLLPFILIEAPLGRLADTKYGEKEILSLGFIVIAISTAIISFVNTKNIYLWIIILFSTRIGAAMIEIMTDTYFFKKVNESRVNIVSIFRTLHPWSYVLGPLIAGTFLLFGVPFQYIFLILGIIMLGGLQYSLEIEDTK